jgi:hypothetical protein
MAKVTELYEGFHKNSVGNSFEVFGVEDKWFWWQREPMNPPLTNSDGPYESSEAAYIVAMRND